MQNDATVSFKFRAGLQRDNEVFVTQADQLRQIAVTCQGLGRFQ
jgi:hypothetical protein